MTGLRAPSSAMTSKAALDSPLLRVSRSVSACSRCRAAKVKCDGKLPSCTACEKLGRSAECFSVTDQFARGRERSYVASLESRIEKLERRLAQKVGNPLSPSIASPSSNGESPFPDGASTRTVLAHGKERQKEDADIEDLVSDFGFLAVNATSRDFFGFTSGMSFARLVLTPATLEEIPHSVQGLLPPRHLAQSLIKHYFCSQFLLLPFFVETSFYASLNAVYQGQARDWDHWIVFMVLAIASASLSQRRDDHHHRASLAFANTALTKAENVLHPGSMSGVQAILFLVQFSLYQPDHFDSWYLIGMASRTMVDLGMHQERPGTNPDPAREIRRRVFYCLYSLDRSISMVLRRAFSFSDDSVDVPFPAAEPDASHPSRQWDTQLQSIDVALHLFRLRRLQSCWYQDLFQSGRSAYSDGAQRLAVMADEMRRWFDASPSSTPSWARCVFELELLYSEVYLMAPSRRIPAVDMREDAATLEKCLRFSKKMQAALADPVLQTVLPPHEALRVYFMSHRFLDVLWSNANILELSRIRSLSSQAGEENASSTSRPAECVEQINEVLTTLGARWSRSTQFQKVFKARYDASLAETREWPTSVGV